MDSSYQEVWDDIYQDGYYTHYPNESIVRFIFTRLPRDLAKRRDNKVLDIGCGTGNNTWMIAKEGFDTYGFDGSRVALDLNENRLKEMQLSAHLSQGDF
ncbi:class I SAM-dependent methyltransferase, partial [Chloroflexota bacterium]